MLLLLGVSIFSAGCAGGTIPTAAGAAAGTTSAGGGGGGGAASTGGGGGTASAGGASGGVCAAAAPEINIANTIVPVRTRSICMWSPLSVPRLPLLGLAGQILLRVDLDVAAGAKLRKEMP